MCSNILFNLLSPSSRSLAFMIELWNKHHPPCHEAIRQTPTLKHMHMFLHTCILYSSIVCLVWFNDFALANTFMVAIAAWDITVTYTPTHMHNNKAPQKTIKTVLRQKMYKWWCLSGSCTHHCQWVWWHPSDAYTALSSHNESATSKCLVL